MMAVAVLAVAVALLVVAALLVSYGEGFKDGWADASPDGITFEERKINEIARLISDDFGMSYDEAKGICSQLVRDLRVGG